MSGTERGLRVVVFLTGLFELATSILLLFFPGVYKVLFDVAPGFNSYYIRQIGMFELLVGSFILFGAFDAQIRPFALFALYFHVANLPFEATYAVLTWGEPGLFPLSMAFFVVFHIVMIFVIAHFMRRNAIRIFDFA